MTSQRLAGNGSCLIVLTGSLGDVARGLPLAAVLKAGHPARTVSWIVERRWAPLVELSRHVDEVIPFDRDCGVSGAVALVRGLRARRFDTAFDLQRILKSGLIARMSGAPRRIGFHPKDAKEGNAWLNTEHIAERGDASSKVLHYLAFAEHVGLSRPASLSFGLEAFDVRDRCPAALRTATRPVVTIAVGASRPSKEWPAAEWRRLCELILADGRWTVALVGTRPASTPNVDDDASTLDTRRVVDLRARTTLPELVAVLGLSVLAIGPDTGTGHVAAAVGTRYVGLFGPTRPARVAPWGSEHLAVTSQISCLGCRRRCRRRGGPCMATISAEHVWDTVRRTLGAAEGLTT